MLMTSPSQCSAANLSVILQCKCPAVYTTPASTFYGTQPEAFTLLSRCCTVSLFCCCTKKPRGRILRDGGLTVAHSRGKEWSGILRQLLTLHMSIGRKTKAAAQPFLAWDSSPRDPAAYNQDGSSHLNELNLYDTQACSQVILDSRV